MRNAKRLLLVLPLVTALAVTLSPPSRSQEKVAQEKVAAYKIDPGHSSVLFHIRHLGLSHTWGWFAQFGGTVSFRDGGEGSSVALTVDAASLDTRHPGRDKHLKSPDFFSVGEFEKITFNAKSWKKTGDDTYDLTGDLALHGVTKSVTAKVKKIGEGERGKFGYRIGFDAELKIKRSDFGMKKFLDFVGDEVTLQIAIEAQRQ